MPLGDATLVRDGTGQGLQMSQTPSIARYSSRICYGSFGQRYSERDIMMEIDRHKPDASKFAGGELTWVKAFKYYLGVHLCV